MTRKCYFINVSTQETDFAENPTNEILLSMAIRGMKRVSEKEYKEYTQNKVNRHNKNRNIFEKHFNSI